MLAGKRLAIFVVILAPFALAGVVALIIFGGSSKTPTARPVGGPGGGPPGPGAPPVPGVPRVGAPVGVGNLFKASNVVLAKAALARQAGPRTQLIRAVITPTAVIFGVARGGALVNYLWLLERRGFLATPTSAAGAAQGMKTLPLSSLDARAPGRIVAAVRRLTHDQNAIFYGLNLSRRPDTGVLYWSVAVRLGTRTGVFSAAPPGTGVRRIA